MKWVKKPFNFRKPSSMAAASCGGLQRKTVLERVVVISSFFTAHHKAVSHSGAPNRLLWTRTRQACKSSSVRMDYLLPAVRLCILTHWVWGLSCEQPLYYWQSLFVHFQPTSESFLRRTNAHLAAPLQIKFSVLLPTWVKSPDCSQTFTTTSTNWRSSLRSSCL